MRRRRIYYGIANMQSDLIHSKKFQCTKTGFQRCAMQINKGALSSVKLMKQRKSENADDTNQITDGTMQNKRRQEEVDVMSCVLAL
ncbi:hypothetical protein T12_6460 [Trichinella patagoniensis]|uniref:Uncharacterized protein n=1 Tax=Trichinella patagoniensis TaxID=990121 RepID=A0A0V0ZVW4_9BILA|nr:hypothetical protein T12_6460 [Trichinella patagoniensis]